MPRLQTPEKNKETLVFFVFLSYVSFFIHSSKQIYRPNIGDMNLLLKSELIRKNNWLAHT